MPLMWPRVRRAVGFLSRAFMLLMSSITSPRVMDARSVAPLGDHVAAYLLRVAQPPALVCKVLAYVVFGYALERGFGAARVLSPLLQILPAGSTPRATMSSQPFAFSLADARLILLASPIARRAGFPVPGQRM